MREPRGTLVISLDFELYWGVRDITSLPAYRLRAEQLRAAVPCLLNMFRERGMHATWATVGLLFFRSREELMAGLPRVLPDYADPELSPYPHLADLGPGEAEDPSHYAASLVRAIAETPHQEVGTHTFSHYYCLEEGQNAEAFRADLEAAAAASDSLGLTVRSLVFPRNQANADYLGICEQAGIRAYRGNSPHWLYQARQCARESQWRRALRLADAYLNLSGHNAYSLAGIGRQFPCNIPSSRLLRTHLRSLDMLEPLRLRRFLGDLDGAAARGEMYHLWLHPEEFGSSMERNRPFFERILDHFALLRERHGMETLNMGELAVRLAAPDSAHPPVTEHAIS